MNPSPNSPISAATSPLAGPAPTVSSVSPSSGSTAGGTGVTITGTGFTGATAVRFGATAASGCTVNSDTRITAVAPAGTGAVQVTVTTPGGTSAQFVVYGYATVPAPTLTSVSPTSGPVAGGNTVTLTGSGLTNATAVRFGGTAATSFTVVSDIHITAVAPAGTGTVQITVATRGGAGDGISYAYAALPVASGVSPDQGPTSGGNTVALTGTGFTGATAVLFGATAALSFTVVSATQITAVAPPGSAGPASVNVTAPAGISAAGPSYFYVNAPVLSGVSPSSGPLAGGNTATLTGSHLIEATAVRFGATSAASFTAVSDTRLTAQAPPGSAGSTRITVTTAGGTSNPIPYGYLVAPTLSAVSPTQGSLAGGDSATLTGTNLTQTTAVLFGAVRAAFTVVSDTHIVATAPSGTAGPVGVSVVTPGGTSPAVAYARVAPPTI
ncbi:IPT/TIG domain-containing protein [Streptomyces ferralitis]|uniref:IPT/TIG domain-containing protein n=1 Tax=Streptantibioticus ferralitis TaxID=236510 RepID=A0ABT5YVM5_9ACTN|nr:IPT/TIG domain-containing protein [Streptantibioticus ferralitis]